MAHRMVAPIWRAAGPRSSLRSRRPSWDSSRGGRCDRPGAPQMVHASWSHGPGSTAPNGMWHQHGRAFRLLRGDPAEQRWQACKPGKLSTAFGANGQMLIDKHPFRRVGRPDDVYAQRLPDVSTSAYHGSPLFPLRANSSADAQIALGTGRLLGAAAGQPRRSRSCGWRNRRSSPKSLRGYTPVGYGLGSRPRVAYAHERHIRAICICAAESGNPFPPSARILGDWLDSVSRDSSLSVAYSGCSRRARSRRFGRAPERCLSCHQSGHYGLICAMAGTGLVAGHNEDKLATWGVGRCTTQIITVIS